MESAGCYFDRLGTPVVLLTVDDAILCIVCVFLLFAICTVMGMLV